MAAKRDYRLNIEAHTSRVSLKSFRAAASRRELIAELGGCCSACGAVENLEFDLHPVRETSHHFMPWPQRIRFYWAQHHANNVQLLCKRCHTTKTARENRKANGVRVQMSSAFFLPVAGQFCDGDGI